MKNSLNLGFVILLLVVLGCNCPNIKDLGNTSTPGSTPSTSNTSNSTTTSSPSKSTTSKLTLDKYNQIKNGMTYKEVVDIIGSEGVETMSSGEGKYKVTSYQWKGGDFEYIYCVFMGEKLTSKTQANLK